MLYPHHKLSYLICTKLLRIGNLLHFSIINNADCIRTIHDFIKFQRNQENRLSGISLCNNLLMDIFNGTDIQTSCRLHKNHQIRIQLNLSSNNRFLLISTAHGAHNRLTALSGTNIILCDKLFSIFPNRLMGKDALLRKTLISIGL